MSRFLKQPAEPELRPSSASVYEQRGPSEQDSAERWVPVGEIDPQTGDWTVVLRPGWERRAQGWAPLHEFLGLSRW